MRKERKDIALGAIQLNTGQIDWLPANPRTWTQSDIDDMRDSILEDQDFLEDRPLLVVPFGKAFVVFGGNLRHVGAVAAKLSKAPCVVYHNPETAADYATILRRAMKDNGQFGKTNWDAIYSSKWGTLPLEKWGLTPKGWTEPEGGEGENGGSPDDYGTEFNLPDGERTGFRQVSFQLSDEMAEVVLFATKAAHYTEEFYTLEGDEEDKNGNGVAVYLMAKWWLDMIAKEPGVDYEKAKAEAEGLRQYLRDALAKSGRKAKDIDAALGTKGMSGHYFGESQWMFPTQKAYKIMQEFMPLDRDYLECKLIELRYNLLKTLKTQWEGQKK